METRFSALKEGSPLEPYINGRHIYYASPNSAPSAMSMAELDPVHVLGGPSSISNPRPLEPQKISNAPVPPTTHPLFVEGALANLTLNDTRLGQSQESAHQSPSDGEGAVAESHAHPPARDETKPPPVTNGSSSAAVHSLLQQSLAKVADEVLSPINNPHGPQYPANNPPKRIDDEFALSGLQPLQTFIPDDLFPDDLLVHDPDNITKLWHDLHRPPPDIPVRYARIFPNLKVPPEPFLPYLQRYPHLKEAHERHMPPPPAFLHRSPAEPARVAHLYLKAENRVGKGHHSSVFSAPLRLRLDPQSGVETTARVAAKTARGTCGAHTMLEVEASVYDAFPRHLMDDQYVSPAAAVVTPDAQPTTAETEGSIEPAVVPKFFGYYAAVDADGRAVTPLHTTCDPDATCPVPWPTRILLVEECGHPIVPGVFTQEQKLRCLHLVQRLNAAGFAQNSMHRGNVLVQPGPLRLPPALRSYASPSFRIIDFGRGVALAHLPPSIQTEVLARLCHGEQWRAAYRVLEVCSRAQRDANAGEDCTKAERWALETVLCQLYAALISLHAS